MTETTAKPSLSPSTDTASRSQSSVAHTTSSNYAAVITTISSLASSTIGPSSATPTETTSSSSSSGVSAPIIGTVSSIGAVLLAVGLAWLLVRRKRRREDREHEVASETDKRVQPAFFSVLDDRPAPAPLVKHDIRSMSELGTQIPKHTPDSKVHELHQHVSALKGNRHTSQAPSELHGSPHPSMSHQRLSTVSVDYQEASSSQSAKQPAKIIYQPYRDIRQSKLPEAIIELPA